MLIEPAAYAFSYPVTGALGADLDIGALTEKKSINRAIRCETAGTLVYKPASLATGQTSSTTVTVTLAAGEWFPVQMRAIVASGTTATFTIHF